MAEDKTPNGPYADWIGRTETQDEDITLAPVQAMMATLDINGSVPAPVPGDPLPPLWHWLYFLPRAPASKIGADGHPQRGGFLPPVALPRRMFAGGRMTFHQPLILGRPARRLGEIRAVKEKSGSAGHLVFVTVGYRIEQDGRLCIEEEQDIVYREPGAPVPPPVPAAVPDLPEETWERTITPDPVLLFRFSALTFNAHRIHYDRPYATTEEGYPGLVVHGPLVAVLLADLVRRNTSRPVTGFQFRGQAPLFDLAPFRLVGRAEGNAVALEALGPDGKTAQSATATLGW